MARQLIDCIGMMRAVGFLLSFMAEHEAYVTAHQLLSQSEQHCCRYLCLSYRIIVLFARAFSELMEEHLAGLFYCTFSLIRRIERRPHPLVGAFVCI